MAAPKRDAVLEQIAALEQRVAARKSAKQRAEEAWKTPVVVWKQTDAEQKALLELAWRRGELRYKCTPSQAGVYDRLAKWQEDHDSAWEQGGCGILYTLDISRRWGKDFLFIIKALEIANKRPGSRIVYCAPTMVDVKKILLPLIKIILADCPPALEPKYAKSESTWHFPNGSYIDLVGLDINPDKARGTFVDAIFLSEAGFFDNLEYLTYSVLFPQMLGRRWARVFCASTPSKTPGHFWSSEMVPKAILRGVHDSKTLLDADQYTDEEKLFFMDENPGGRRGTTTRREYFVEHITDEESAILVEFRDVEAKVVTDQFVIPQWRDCYTILDPGFNDLAASIFCYWDFHRGVLVVEDEFAKAREHSKGVADGIKAKELELWKTSQRRGPGFSLRPQPYMRFSDNDPRLIYDLAVEHKLIFAGVQKKSLELMVNAVRVALVEGKIEIHPRCKKLVLHCRNGIWRSRKTKNLEFARPGGEFGHFDLIACLVYAWLSVQKHRNPTPAVEKVVRGDIRIKGQHEGQKRKSKWAGQARYRTN